jgi:hypothetical protein
MHKMLPQIHHNPGWHDCAKGQKGVKAQKEAHIDEQFTPPWHMKHGIVNTIPLLLHVDG